MDKTRTSSTLIAIALTLFIILFVFFMYTFLHEGGHALTGALFGQALAEFDISFWDLSAHVHMVGGQLTEPQLAVQAVAGAGLPLVVWAIFISLVPRKASFTLEVLKLLSSMVVVNTLLAWIILSILFFLQKAPPDDVTNFLRHSQMPPLLLTFSAILLYAGGWILFLSKIDGLRNELLLFSSRDRAQLLAGTPKTLPAITGFMALCIVSVIALNSFADGNLINKFVPPQDFVQVAQIELSEQAYPSETLTQFTVAEPTYVGVFIVIRNINTTYFDLSVTGAHGFSSTVVHGEGYNTAQDGGLWEQKLPAGIYQVVLTSHQSPGSVSVYIKTD
jgi:hypothetical protein